MDIKRILSGNAEPHDTQRFWFTGMAIGYGLLLVDNLIDSKFFAQALGSSPEANAIPLLAFVATLMSLIIKTDVREKAKIASAILSSLFLLSFVLAFPYVVGFFNYGNVLSMPAVGFVLVVMAFPSVLASALSTMNLSSKTRQQVSPTASEVMNASSHSEGNLDAVLYTAIAGAAALALSLLALPWFALESFDWNDSMNVTFNNLRDVYNDARDNGFDGDVRFFYLEWGYIVSYAAAIFSAVSALRLRDDKVTVSVPLLNVAIGATCLVGLWQGTIATALTQLDDDGSVQFGVWLGVIGHVAIVASFVMMRQMMNRRNVYSPVSNLPH